MPPLDAPPAVGARPDVDAKRADRWPLHRQRFLILRRDGHGLHGARAYRTAPGQRRVVGVIHARRPRTLAASAIRGTRFPTGPLRRGHARAAGERRRLSIDRPACGVEFLFQFLVFAPQPVTLRLRPAQILAQSLDLSTLVVDDVVRVVQRLIAPRWHAPLMPDSRAQYKRKPLCLRVSVARDQREGRVSMVLTR